MMRFSIFCVLVVSAGAGVLKKRSMPSVDLGGYTRMVKGLLDQASEELQEVPNVRFSGHPEDVSVKAGQEVRLTCEALGTPPPIVYWKFNGEVVKQGEHQMENNIYDKLLNLGKKTVQNGVTDSELLISCVDEETAGIYECVASNGIIEVFAHSTVRLLSGGKGRCASNTESNDYPPHIYMWSDSRFEIDERSAQLFCRANGQPKPAITWHNEEGLMIDPTNEKYQLLANGDLIVKKGGWDVLGVYQCRAANAHGSTARDIFYYPTEEKTTRSVSNELTFF